MENLNLIKPEKVQNIINKFCYTIGMIPTSYKVSLTYEEQIIAIGHYLEETVIPALNNNAEAVAELQTLFVQLKDYVENYFDNLDVQNEINKKLDEMVQDGTLSEIINQELLANINQQISNLQTQQGQMTTNISNLSTNLNNNINKTNNNETQINNLKQTKADNSDLIDFVNNTNQAINNQYEIIGRLQGGTPIVVSDISAMTDTSKIYVLTTNGQWYYYDGSSFVSGGTYQASEFSKDSIVNNAIKNVDYSKVQCVPLIEELTTDTWNGASVSFHSKNNIQINTSTSSQENAGVFIMNLNDIDKTKDLVISASVSGINYSLYLYDGKYTYVDGLFEGRSQNINKDMLCLIKSSQINNLSDPKLLIASSEKGNLYILNLTLTYYNNYDFKLKNLIEKTKEISPFYNNIKENAIETDLLQWTTQTYGWGGNIMLQTPRDFTYFRSTGSQGQSRGVTSPLLSRTDKKLIIEADVENVGQDELNFDFYLVKENQNEFVSVGGNNNVDSNGHLKIIIDLPYYSVYEGYNNYYIWLMSSLNGYIRFINFKFYYSDIAETSIYGETFNDIIKNIDSKISGSSTSKSDVSYIQAPNNKYFMQANDNGNLQLIDVIPNKTLFIGNSLLLGNHHGDYSFGMCATDINNDYYYHITQYILNRKSNAQFEKMSGTDFEGATSNESVSNFLNNILLPKLNSELQLVIVQLGDNVNTADKLNIFNSSCLQLLQFIRTHAPNSRVVFVGEWYSSAQKQNIIAQACKNSGSQFVDISMLNVTENQSSIGTTITFPDGYTTTVESSGVASHPGNVGFRKIADKIINEIF